MEYDSRVNERQTQTTEEKIDTSNALDALDASSTTAYRALESNNEVDLTRMLFNVMTHSIAAKLTDNTQLNSQNQLLESENIYEEQLHKEKRALETYLPKILIDTSDSETGFAIAAFKNELRKLTGNSVNTKFAKPSILGKPVLQPHRNQFAIPTGHRFSIKRTSTVHEKTTSPRSCLRWQPTGRILKTVCLRWVPTGKIFTSSTTKVDSEPPNGSKEDITNQCESEQALDVSAGTLLSTADQASVFMAMTFEQRSSSLVLHQMTSDHNRSELGIQDHSNEQSSSKLVPKVVP
ncbi:hypothetical protein Tco_0699751 [Tanacetum coccineum]